MTPALREAFLENPEYIVALMLSAPDQKENLHQSVTIDFSNDEVRATVPRPDWENPETQLLASKDTIYAAIVLYQVWMERGQDYSDSLLESARRFGRYRRAAPARF